MTPKPPVHYVRGNPNLLRMLEAEDPEFIIEDATESADTPPVESPEAVIFLDAAKELARSLNRPNGKNGHTGQETPSSPPAETT